MEKGMTRGRRMVSFFCGAVMALSILLSVFLPPARQSVLALCNRLFAASEKVNAYAYDRFPVPVDQPLIFAWVLTAAFLCSYLILTAALRSRIMLLLAAMLAALGQAYFGLSLSPWANMALFFLLGLMAALFSAPKKSVLPFTAAALLIAALTAGLWPGVDAATESASENVRDRLALLTQQEESFTGDSLDSAMETRHMNTRSLLTGGDEAQKSREYRLLTVEEQQISQPRWIDYFKIALLLLLSAAMVILPFLPFLYFNAHRKKALEARRLFQAENPGEALCAMFRHAAAYLENGGCGGGNLPFRQWPDTWQDRLPDDYKQQFAACACLFEEAAYSNHPMTEAQREEMRLLLAETERIFFEEADWKEKLRLRYGKCLHE